MHSGHVGPPIESQRSRHSKQNTCAQQSSMLGSLGLQRGVANQRPGRKAGTTARTHAPKTALSHKACENGGRTRRKNRTLAGRSRIGVPPSVEGVVVGEREPKHCVGSQPEQSCQGVVRLNVESSREAWDLLRRGANRRHRRFRTKRSFQTAIKTAPCRTPPTPFYGFLVSNHIGVCGNLSTDRQHLDERFELVMAGNEVGAPPAPPVCTHALLPSREGSVSIRRFVLGVGCALRTRSAPCLPP